MLTLVILHIRYHLTVFVTLIFPANVYITCSYLPMCFEAVLCLVNTAILRILNCLFSKCRKISYKLTQRVCPYSVLDVFPQVVHRSKQITLVYCLEVVVW